jgi:uncharacterized membrane protein YhaH (DUF805 family)
MNIGRLHKKTFLILYLLVMTAYLVVQPLGFGYSFGQGTDDLLIGYSGIELLPGGYLYDLPGFYHASPVSFLTWAIFTYGLLLAAVILIIGRLHDIGKGTMWWLSICWFLVVLAMGSIPFAYLGFLIPPPLMILLVFFSPLLLVRQRGNSKVNTYGSPPQPLKPSKTYYTCAFLLFIILVLITIIVKHIQIQHEAIFYK